MQLGDEVGTGAGGGEVHRLDDGFHVEVGEAHLPYISQGLECIAGVGEDDPLQEAQIAAQGLIQRAATEGAGVALQVGIGAAGDFTVGADAHRHKAGSVDDLLRHVGTEVAHSPTVRIAVGPVEVGGLSGLDKRVQNLCSSVIGSHLVSSAGKSVVLAWVIMAQNQREIKLHPMQKVV